MLHGYETGSVSEDAPNHLCLEDQFLNLKKLSCSDKLVKRWTLAATRAAVTSPAALRARSLHVP